MKLVAVPGTWAFKGDDDKLDWWEFGPYGDSPWWAMAREAGFEPMKQWPFAWSTALSGVEWPWKNKRERQIPWHAGAHHFLDHVNGTDKFAVVCHSHGLQVVLYAAAHGRKIPALLSVCSPIRHDVTDIAIQARPNIGYWIHLYGDEDSMQLLGEFDDGQLTWPWNMKFRKAEWYKGETVVRADIQHFLPGFSHSQVLYPPDVSLWQTQGWFTSLMGALA